MPVRIGQAAAICEGLTGQWIRNLKRVPDTLAPGFEIAPTSIHILPGAIQQASEVVRDRWREFRQQLSGCSFQSLQADQELVVLGRIAITEGKALCRFIRRPRLPMGSAGPQPHASRRLH
jgi:hypothetical protein